MIKVFLDKVTLDKIRIYSGDGLKEISNFIDLENLPKNLGGYSKFWLEDNPGPWREDFKLFWENDQRDFSNFYKF